jgi:transcriptional regulator with XRE-family HTH domain
MQQMHQRKRALRRLVKRHGAAEVSARIGVSPGTLSSVLLGRAPQASTLAAIGRAFEQLGDALGLESSFAAAPLPYEPERELPSKRPGASPKPGNPFCPGRHLRLVPSRDGGAR